MNTIINIILAAQMLAAVTMVGLILVQHGKGADMGAAFGSGSSGSLFGASGSANFLSRTTAVLAGIFFVATLALTYFASTGGRGAESSTTVPGFAAPVVVPEVPGTVVPGASVQAASAASAPAAAPAAAASANAPSAVPAVVPGAAK